MGGSDLLPRPATLVDGYVKNSLQILPPRDRDTAEHIGELFGKRDPGRIRR
jgi:hypothetical protein